jgi:hypothetical protein
MVFFFFLHYEGFEKEIVKLYLSFKHVFILFVYVGSDQEFLVGAATPSEGTYKGTCLRFKKDLDH